MSEIDRRMEAAKAKADEVATEAGKTLDRAGEAFEEAKQKASAKLDDVRAHAGEALEEARAHATEALKDARENVAKATEDLREKASDHYGRAQDWAHERYDSLSRNATYARRRSVAEFNRGRRGIAAFVEENPIMIGVAGLAAGLLIGALLPRTRREDELLGRYADDLRREGTRYAKETMQHGRDTLSDNLRSIVEPPGRDDR